MANRRTTGSIDFHPTERPAWLELQNLRGRIEREAFRAVREGREYEGRQLYQSLQELRPTRQRSAQRILEELEAREYTQPHIPPRSEFDEQRVSAMFSQQMRAGLIPEERKRGFYAATRQIWQGNYRGDRNEQILEYFYSDDSPDAEEFRAWLERKGYALDERNLFRVEEYVRERNRSVLASATAEGGYPYKAFARLVTFG